MKANIIDVGLYADWIKDKIAETTAKMYISAVEDFLSTNPDIDTINSYNECLVEHVYKKRAYYYYYALKSFIQFEIKDIGLRNMLIKNLVKPKNSTPVKNTMYMTPGQREAVLANIKEERHRLVFKIMSQTGARVGDILRLKRGSITYEKHQGEIAMRLNIVGKGEKLVAKWIYDKSLQDEIITWISNKYLDPVFYFADPIKCNRKNKNNERVILHSNYVYAWADLKQALLKVGINPKLVATHDFRRSVSQDIYTDKEMGNDLIILQRFLGHSRLETTARYVKSAGFDNKEISFKLAKKLGKL